MLLGEGRGDLVVGVRMTTLVVPTASYFSWLSGDEEVHLGFEVGSQKRLSRRFPGGWSGLVLPVVDGSSLRIQVRRMGEGPLSREA